MCIELHKPSAESVNAHLECAQDEKYVPSQFERGSIANIAETALNHGFSLAKQKSILALVTRAKESRSLDVHSFAQLLSTDILELTP